jgi:hypothetical protein
MAQFEWAIKLNSDENPLEKPVFHRSTIPLFQG